MKGEWTLNVNRYSFDTINKSINHTVNQLQMLTTSYQSKSRIIHLTYKRLISHQFFLRKI